ncbi:hypothetical protein BDW67DRAFT_152100, partial [Aspergillus spinulosporus]
MWRLGVRRLSSWRGFGLWGRRLRFCFTRRCLGGWSSSRWGGSLCFRLTWSGFRRRRLRLSLAWGSLRWRSFCGRRRSLRLVSHGVVSGGGVSV